MPQQQRIGKTATSVFTDPQDGMTKVVYHSTPVVSFDDKRIILNTGGWQTTTTRTRMNQAANQFNLGFRVFQREFYLFAKFKGKEIVFLGTSLTLER